MVLAWLEGSARYGIRKSFQMLRPFSTTSEAVQGPSRGNTTRQNALNSVQPSILAASSMSMGTPFKKLVYSSVPKATEPAM